MTPKTPLEFAVSQLGVKEEPGNKGTPFARYALLGEDPLPWCGRFVRWCFKNAGESLPGNRYLLGRVETMLEELRVRGAVIRHQVEAVEPGDIIFLRDRGASDAGDGSHVGIVESVGELTINSIDGNYGDAVKRVARERHSPEIKAIARWPVRASA